MRNDLFEKVIKSCKATNLEFPKLKEKLGLCLYEDICDEKEFILMSEESFIQHDQHDVKTKQLKEENKKLNKNKNDNDNDNDNENENENENENKNKNENKIFEKNKIVKDANIQKLIEKPKEIK